MQYTISSRKSLDSGDIRATSMYLVIDENGEAKAIPSRVWVKSILKDLQTLKEAGQPDAMEPQLLFFVHGYNVDFESSFSAQVNAATWLSSLGWRGIVVGFDWPSDGLTFAYLNDREHARQTANRLIADGVKLFEQIQTADCPFPVHVMAHSMGAFVVREAFENAYQDVPPSWQVGQLVLVAGDIAYDEMLQGRPGALAFLRYARRFTNYINRYDRALSVSDVKRLNMTRRLGRVGLPDEAPSEFSNVDCTDLFDKSFPGDLIASLNPVQTHCFYFEQKAFWQDVLLTLAGGTDRTAISTRSAVRGLLPGRSTLQTAPKSDSEFERALALARMPPI